MTKRKEEESLVQKSEWEVTKDDSEYPYDVVSCFMEEKLQKSADVYGILAARQQHPSWVDVAAMMQSLDRLVEETCVELGLPLPPGWQKWEDEQFPAI